MFIHKNLKSHSFSSENWRWKGPKDCMHDGLRTSTNYKINRHSNKNRWTLYFTWMFKIWILWPGIGQKFIVLCWVLISPSVFVDEDVWEKKFSFETSTAKFLWAAQTKKGTECKLKELNASSRNCMQAQGTACKIRERHASSCNCMQAQGTAFKLM